MDLDALNWERPEPKGDDVGLGDGADDGDADGLTEGDEEARWIRETEGKDYNEEAFGVCQI